METEIQKQAFLGTRVTELELGNGVNKLFLFDILKRKIAPEDILTVAELIEINKHITTKSELIVCNKKGHKMLDQNTSSGKLIFNCLRDAGFTEKDWAPLALKKEKVKVEKVVITPETDKEILKKLPYTQVCGLRPSARTTQYINQILDLCLASENKDVYDLQSFLQITQATVMSTFFISVFPVDIFPQLQVSLNRAYANLKKLGFSEQDGPFMLIPSKWFSKKATYCDNETVLARVQNGQLDLGFTAPKVLKIKSDDESAMVG
jgi:hypothetical protein